MLSSSSMVWGNPSLVEQVLSFAKSLNDVKRCSGANRASRRARWPFETLSGHVTITQMVTRSGKDKTYVSEPRVAEAAKLSDGAITAMIEQLCSHRALTAGGSLIKQLCAECASTLRAGTRASAARAAFSLGYACVRSENGWANAHAIVGACAHAALAAIAFQEEKEEANDLDYESSDGKDDLSSSPPPSKRRRVRNGVAPKRFGGWGAREACSWALVQLLSVTKKRHSCKSLVSQLRQLGVVKACVSSLLSVTASDAQRELCAQLLVLTCTEDIEYVGLISRCPLEELCVVGTRGDATSLISRRARHAAQFAAQGVSLPPSLERKRKMVEFLCERARSAATRASEASSSRMQIFENAADADSFTALALMAENCAEEMSASAVEICGKALFAAVAADSADPERLRLVVADACACLEQLALYFGELEAAEDDMDALDDADEEERAAIAAERASRRASQSGNSASDSLRNAPVSLALSLLSKLAGDESVLGAAPIDTAWVRAVDGVVAYVAARAPLADRDDVRLFVRDSGGDSFVEILVACELKRMRHNVERQDDLRFYFGTPTETNALSVLALCASHDEFKAAIQSKDLLQAIDKQRVMEEQEQEYFDEEEDAGYDFHQANAQLEAALETVVAVAAHVNSDQEEDDDDDDDDDDEDEDIFIVLDHGEDDEEPSEDDDDDDEESSSSSSSSDEEDDEEDDDAQ